MNNLFQNKNVVESKLENDYYIIQNKQDRVSLKQGMSGEAGKIENFDRMSNEDELFLRKLSNSRVKSEEKFINNSCQKLSSVNSNIHIYNKNITTSSF